MSGRLIWFFGPSAAGKHTLIVAIERDSTHPLRRTLDLDADVMICDEGSDAVRRDRLGEVVRSLAAHGVPLLIKGQTTDITARGLPETFAEEFRQEVVFVWVEPYELARRCAERAARYRAAGDVDRAGYWEAQGEPQCRSELYSYQGPAVLGLDLRTIYVYSRRDTVEIGREPPNW